ncbi:MAG: UMP kinase [Candidatus Kariarchaeaceae archaeon]
MKIVVKIGGSILYNNEGELQPEIINKFSSIIKEFVQEGNLCAVVVGGGKIARKYIHAASIIGGTREELDHFGIECTRLNAKLVVLALKPYSHSHIPTNQEEIQEAFSSNKIVVSGGMKPGQSTNAVAAQISEIMGAEKLINISNVDYIYDKDPRVFDDAQPIYEMKVSELLEIMKHSKQEPGKYGGFDKVGAEILARSKTTLQFINGNDSTNLEKALKGEKIGSIVRPK